MKARSAIKLFKHFLYLRGEENMKFTITAKPIVWLTPKPAKTRKMKISFFLVNLTIC